MRRTDTVDGQSQMGRHQRGARAPAVCAWRLCRARARAEAATVGIQRLGLTLVSLELQHDRLMIPVLCRARLWHEYAHVQRQATHRHMQVRPARSHSLFSQRMSRDLFLFTATGVGGSLSLHAHFVQ